MQLLFFCLLAFQGFILVMFSLYAEQKIISFKTLVSIAAIENTGDV
jgi:hypothetical protein